MDAYKYATEIIKKLAREGYTAYFAGGWVRDYVMGHPSEDIDIATSASPAQIMDLFPDTILVGLAFGVVIVLLGGHQFEVATFRRDLPSSDGRRPEGIESSSPQEDAFRRDFTINGMFYDPVRDVIYDFVNGQEDIARGIVRTIGDPHERFFEDRLRMLRAFRFSARFGFYIDPETQDAIKEHSGKLFPAVAPERVWQEFGKMAGYPRFERAIIEMHRLSIIEEIYPELKNVHLTDLRRFTSAYAHFPEECSPLLYLMQLFPTTSIEKKIEIGKRIKASNKEIKILMFIDELSVAIRDEDQNQSVNEYIWVHLYVNPQSLLALKFLAASLDPEERSLFLHKHAERKKKLESHILRVLKNQPVVTSDLLRKQGIIPGKKMGLLLKEAEKMAIENDIQNPDEIISRLKSNPLWNYSNGH